MPDPFLILASALFSECGVPKADAEDSMAGAEIIPSEVTDARRKGLHVTFHNQGGLRECYWMLPDGKKIYHP